MLLSYFKNLLNDYPEFAFRIILPDGSQVPLSFHISEVGHIKKTYLDCGGKKRKSVVCQLQIWLGDDYNHRLETSKMASILEKAQNCLPDDRIPLEIEYENKIISQYTIAAHEITHDSIVLILAHKHTECLAPELCGLSSKTVISLPVNPILRCSGPNCC